MIKDYNIKRIEDDYTRITSLHFKLNPLFSQDKTVSIDWV